MPIRVGEMSPAIPLTALLAILLGAMVARFIHARNRLAELLLRLYGCYVHRILHSTEGGAARKRHLADGLDYANLVHAATRNIHPAVASCCHISHRTAARRDVRSGKFLRMGIEPDILNLAFVS